MQFSINFKIFDSARSLLIGLEAKQVAAAIDAAVAATARTLSSFPKEDYIVTERVYWAPATYFLPTYYINSFNINEHLHITRMMHII